MSGRPKRRGRPPKTPGADKPKFQMHLLKKPKYLQNIESVNTTPVATVTPQTSKRSSASRRSAQISASGRNTSVVETPSRTTRRSTQKPKTPKTPVVSKPRARSSVSKKKKSTSASDKSHDYHYGSDFDESDKSDDHSESEQSDTNVEDIDDVSDSDFSVSSFSVTSRARKSNVSYIRNPSPEPLWLRDEEIPKLELPKSSEDLLVPTEHIMQALCVYEVLRRFKSQVNFINNFSLYVVFGMLINIFI